ncbi:single-stranded DNA-binding protein [Nocardiopsis alba]|uniref:single-stranded DNA-binding protein n=1 Tax=Nocardiopsis alba TaxID=53437 RepID=UPI00069377D7|nr:single-stranded DNA-binding protein [Nocardiopsis alba]
MSIRRLLAPVLDALLSLFSPAIGALSIAGPSGPRRLAPVSCSGPPPGDGGRRGVVSGADEGDGPTAVSVVPEVPDRDRGHRNEVVVVGRITAPPRVRTLPSGDRLVSWRIGVARPRDPSRPGATGRVDSLTLVSFEERIVDRVSGWRRGSVVRATGALRRRIWRGALGVRSVLEVEVASVSPIGDGER